MTAPASPLTARETEVVQYVGQGWPNKRIALRLGIAVNTVEKHVENAAGRLPNPDRLPARSAIIVWLFSRAA